MELTRSQLILARKKCDNSLAFFTKFFFKELRGSKFITNDHHDVLFQHFDDVSNYKVKLLNINIPPRHSKTEIALNFIARGIGMNPSANWLYISASDELRSEASVRIRDIVTHPYFKIMYGTELKQDQNSKNLWKTTEGGGIKTATIFGQVLGFGAGQMTEAGFNKEDADYIRKFEGCSIWDDINKADDSQSENANNDKVSRVMFNTLFSRENSADTPRIHIQQRTGMSDATAALMEHHGTENPLYRFVIMPIIKADGTPLWKAKMPMHKILELKESWKTKHVFETQYMQNPMPMEGVMFIRSEMSFFGIDELDEAAVSVKAGSIDPANGGDRYSFPSGSIVGNQIFITDWLYSKEKLPTTKAQSVSIINGNKIDCVSMETNSFGVEVFQDVKSKVSKHTAMYGKYATTNKLNRITVKAEFITKHFVFRNDVKEGSDYDLAMKDMYRYMQDGSYKKDDGVDSLAQLATFILKLGLIK